MVKDSYPLFNFKEAFRDKQVWLLFHLFVEIGELPFFLARQAYNRIRVFIQQSALFALLGCVSESVDEGLKLDDHGLS